MAIDQKQYKDRIAAAATKTSKRHRSLPTGGSEDVQEAITKSSGSSELGAINALDPSRCWHSTELHDRWVQNIESDPEFKQYLELFKEHGQKYPGKVVVDTNPDNPSQKYRIVAGSRRWHCANKLGVSFKAYIVSVDTQESIIETILENIRKDPSLIERAHHYKNAIEQAGLSVDEFAKVISENAKTVQGILSYAAIPREIFPSWLPLNTVNRNQLRALKAYVKPGHGNVNKKATKRLTDATSALKKPRAGLENRAFWKACKGVIGDGATARPERKLVAVKNTKLGSVIEINLPRELKLEGDSPEEIKAALKKVIKIM